MVETGQFPSWPRIEMRRPCISSSQTLSTVPALPSVRITALPTSSVWARSNSPRIVHARCFTAGMMVFHKIVRQWFVFERRGSRDERAAKICRWNCVSLAARWGINYHKNSRWRSYRFYRALQRLKSPTHDICEIFGAPRFSSFSTQSARSRLLPFDHLIGAGEFIQAENTGLQPPRGHAAIPLNVSTPENLALLRHGLER